jgi:outer membrane receptor protein involved in Fe transport
VNSISPWLYSFISFDNTQQYDTKGDYDVTDVFAEVRLPIFLDRDFTRELTLDAAVRQADYSTSGKANTWKVGVTWAPIDDIRFRGTVSEAVRAPNISELFDPRLPITVAASSDPCASTNINNGTDAREANCVAALTAIGVSQDAIFTDGVYDWTNPLTARFNGVSGGNPALDVETADTTTYGVVIVPSFAPGFTLSIDYWDVAIEQAIAAVSSDDILKGCYDSSNYPSLDFCNAFTRRGDGGLNFLETGTINFAKLEAEGVDVSASYEFAMGENDFRVSVVGSRQKRLDRFFNPLDTSDVDPELQELQRPRVTGSVKLSWDRGPWSLGVQNVYQGKQAVDEIEEVLGLGNNQAVYGDDGFFDSIVITDINGSYQYSDELTIYGAVNNVTDEEPWSTQNAWPVGPRGRTFVLGVSYSM